MTEYTPAELVRLELLQYENPEGLHPIESNWRDLARKLMFQVQESQQELKDCLAKMNNYDKPSHLKEFKPFKFPEKFKPII